VQQVLPCPLEQLGLVAEHQTQIPQWELQQVLRIVLARLAVRQNQILVWALVLVLPSDQIQN